MSTQLGKICINSILYAYNIVMINYCVCMHFLFFSNSLVFTFKLCAYVYTGSAALLSEAIHSLADVLNQVYYNSNHV